MSLASVPSDYFLYTQSSPTSATVARYECPEHNGFVRLSFGSCASRLCAMYYMNDLKDIPELPKIT